MPSPTLTPRAPWSGLLGSGWPTVQREMDSNLRYSALKRTLLSTCMSPYERVTGAGVNFSREVIPKVSNLLYPEQAK